MRAPTCHRRPFQDDKKRNKTVLQICTWIFTLIMAEEVEHQLLLLRPYRVDCFMKIRNRVVASADRAYQNMSLLLVITALVESRETFSSFFLCAEMNCRSWPHSCSASLVVDSNEDGNLGARSKFDVLAMTLNHRNDINDIVPTLETSFKNGNP